MMIRFLKEVVIAIGLLISVQSGWAACEGELKEDLGSNRYSDAQDVYDSVHKNKEFPRDSQRKNFNFRWPTHENMMSGQFTTSDITIENKINLRSFLTSEVTKFEDSIRNGDFNKTLEKEASLATNATLRNHEIIRQNQYRLGLNFRICIARYYLGLIDSTVSAPKPSDLIKNQKSIPDIGKLSPSQQATTESQQLAQASQQSAQQNQSRADQQRQGKRKTHDPAAEAHECIAIDKAGSGNYGAFKNICNYPVNFSTCNEKPKTIQGGFNWSADFDCAKNQFGLHTPKASASVAAHNRNTEFVYWFACKAPAMPTDVEYTPGKGLVGRCY